MKRLLGIGTLCALALGLVLALAWTAREAARRAEHAELSALVRDIEYAPIPPDTRAAPGFSGGWIAEDEASSAPNTWLAFRRRFAWDGEGDTAVWLSGDTKHQLWLNGERLVVEGGLARGPTPQDSYRERIDLASRLVRGENTLAVLLWHYGRNGLAHHSSGKAALWLGCAPESRGGVCETIASDARWRVRRHPSFGTAEPPSATPREATPNLAFDAREGLGDWTAGGFDDASWASALVLGPVGAPPWNVLVPRPLPALQFEATRSACSDAPAFPVEGDGSVVSCRLPHAMQFLPWIDLEAPAGARVVLRSSDPHDEPGNSATDEGPRTHSVYTTRAGRQQWEGPAWMAGHALEIALPSGATLHGAGVRLGGDPVGFAGSFASSDPWLDALWQRGLRTLRTNLREGTLRCAEGDRALWPDDFATVLPLAFYSLDASADVYAARALRELAAWAWPDGRLSAPVPTDPRHRMSAGAGATEEEDTRDTAPPFLGAFGVANREEPLQALAAIGPALGTYQRYVDDRPTLEAVYPAFRRYLSLWQRDERGLVIPRGDGSAIDSPDTDENLDRAVRRNALVAMALRSLADTARTLGREDEAAALDAQYASLAEAFVEHFWQTNFFRSPAHTGKNDDRAQAFAVRAGLNPPYAIMPLRETMARFAHGSPAEEASVLEALFQLGNGHFALKRLERRYRRMANWEGSTLWQGWERDSAGCRSALASAGPLWLLPAYVVGVRPAAPGFARVRIAPEPSGLAHAAARVRTPHGEVSVSWEAGEHGRVKLEIETPVEAEVVLPGPPRPLAVDGGPAFVAKGVRRQSMRGSRQLLLLAPGRYVID